MNNNWIKCSDSLPELDTPVFAGWFWRGEFVWHAFTRSDSCWEGWVWARSNCVFISDNDDYVEDSDYSRITHWQPMLNPPVREVSDHD
ncbi:DUF551 domain-containing protein [Providencia rettgeri]|uniref:DUF551 domain-containing protein n=1 Tax=Providencia sp. PROV148 TaxID=2949858 RepID=UPI002349C6B0|nr:DUF551 domain-containing protein [Providencia sp. PROV148]